MSEKNETRDPNGGNVLLDQTVSNSLAPLHAYSVFLESYAEQADHEKIDGEVWGHGLAQRVLTDALEKLQLMQERESKAAAEQEGGAA